LLPYRSRSEGTDVTRRLTRVLRKIARTPAWAVHFHDDELTGRSTPCFEPGCRRPPLSVDYRLTV
jgi:hypothetical protein